MYAPHLCSKLLLMAGSDVNFGYQDIVSYIQGFHTTTTATSAGLPSTSQLADDSCMEIVLKTANEVLAVSKGR